MGFFDDLGGFIGSASGAVDELAQGVGGTLAQFEKIQGTIAGLKGKGHGGVLAQTPGDAQVQASSSTDLAPVLLIGMLLFLVLKE